MECQFGQKVSLETEKIRIDITVISAFLEFFGLIQKVSSFWLLFDYELYSQWIGC